MDSKHGASIICNLAGGEKPLTLPRTSRGNFEFMRTGLTLSPESKPFMGNKLSKIPSNFAFSST